MEKPKQNAWNFASLFVYFILLILSGFLIEKKGIDITETSFKDLVIIMLAAYRMTRIVVFEKIFKFFRDFIRTKEKFAVLNTIKFIVTCPWCMGVWMSLIAVLLFFVIPYGKIIVYIMAIAGMASLIIMLANLMVLTVYEKQRRKHLEDDLD
ncbi:MAG: DUF1360 domain-containing protein [Bacteroidales bacterium]|nr:DUF1360 domain-containing protein [Bacteroidales bacterium]